jgi:hypothetical protein
MIHWSGAPGLNPAVAKTDDGYEAEARAHGKCGHPRESGNFLESWPWFGDWDRRPSVKLFCPAKRRGYNRSSPPGALIMLPGEETIPPIANVSTAAPLSALVDYGRAMRAIGQDLTELFPKTVEIEFDGSSFIARGRSHLNPFQQYKESSYKDFWRRLIGRKSARETVDEEPVAPEFERVYGAADIDRLDALYRANRTGQIGRPDSYSFAERLRVMGGIVDSRQGRLKSLRKNADNLFVEYWDTNGEIRNAKLTTVILYRNPQEHPSPNRTPRELWEGYDF